MTYQHYIWDFDGTLFDAYPVMTKAMIETLKTFDIYDDEVRILALMKVSMGYMMEVLEQEYKLGDALVEVYSRTRIQMESEELQPFAHVKAALKRIQENGGDNHLFTHRGVSALEFLDDYGMLDFFKGRITKDSNMPRKPSPEGMYHLIETYHLDPKKTIMVGDRDIDLLSAKNADLATCYLRIGNDGPLDIADYEIRSFEDFPACLDEKK